MERTTSFIESLSALLWNPGTGVLIALLVVAAWIDWRTMRIPNWLTVGGMCWGALWNAASGVTVLDGVLMSLGGLGVGLALFMPLWLIKAMGAGDVKLMAMVGAFLGGMGTVGAVIVVGLVGGISVLIVAISRRAMARLASNTRDLVTSLVIPGLPLWRPDPLGHSLGKLPYGVSISAGTILFLVLAHLGY